MKPTHQTHTHHPRLLANPAKPGFISSLNPNTHTRCSAVEKVGVVNGWMIRHSGAVLCPVRAKTTRAKSNQSDRRHAVIRLGFSRVWPEANGQVKGNVSEVWTYTGISTDKTDLSVCRTWSKPAAFHMLIRVKSKRPAPIPVISKQTAAWLYNEMDGHLDSDYSGSVYQCVW